MLELLLSLISLLTPLTADPAFGAGRDDRVGRVEFCNMDADIVGIEPDPSRQNERLREFLSDKQFVFANGYFGCSSQDFQDGATVIRALDPDVPITSICPPSDIAIENNVDFVADALRAAADKHPGRKMILLGQSKGGAEVLQTLAMRPDLLKREVAAAVTFSAAIGGSIMADLALDVDPELTERWEKFKRENGIDILGFRFDPSSEGFRSLSTPASKARNQKLLSGVTDETREMLANKLFFVTAYRDGKSDDMPPYLRIIAKFMSEQRDSNDGLVFEKDQRLPPLGTHLLEVRRAGHFSLVGEYDPADCRREFTRFLLLKLAVEPMRR